MKLEDLVGEPMILPPVVVTAELPTNGDVLRHFWHIQNATSRRTNGAYRVEQHYAEVARDLINHYNAQSITTIAHNNIVRYNRTPYFAVFESPNFPSLMLLHQYLRKSDFLKRGKF